MYCCECPDPFWGWPNPQEYISKNHINFLNNPHKCPDPFWGWPNLCGQQNVFVDALILSGDGMIHKDINKSKHTWQCGRPVHSLFSN